MLHECSIRIASAAVSVQMFQARTGHRRKHEEGRHVDDA